MKTVDDILDSAKSESDALEKIISYAKKIHGEEVVNGVLDIAEDEESATETMVALARKPRLTKEDRSTFLQNTYQALKGAGYLAKPAELLGATAITETARAPFKLAAELMGTSQTPDIDPSIGYKSFETSPNFGLTLFLTDLSNAMGIKQGPTANFNETEFAKEYPIAANILSELTNPALVGASVAEGYLGAAASRNMPKIDLDKYKKAVSGKYLEAIQKDGSLAQALKDTGKWDDVVDYVSSNYEKLVTPFKKEKALDFLQGPVEGVYDVEQGLRSRRNTDLGKIGQLMDEQEGVLNQIPKSSYSIDPIEARVAAKGNLSGDLTFDQINASERMIDNSIPVTELDQGKVKLLRQLEAYPDNSAQISGKISEEQARLIAKLQNEKQLGLSQLNEMPDYTDPYLMVKNEQKARLESQLSMEMNEINSEIDSIRKLNLAKPENYNKLSSLLKNKKDLESFYYSNFDESAPSLDAYKQLISERNQLPAGYGTVLRRKGNKLIEGSKLNQSAIDAGAEQAAGIAMAKTGSAQESVALSTLPQSDIDMFNALKNEQSKAITVSDLMNKQRIVKGPTGSTIPVGDLNRGILRETVSLFPEYGGPMSYDIMNWINNRNQTAAKAIAPVMGPAQSAGEITRKPQSIIDLVPRGMPINDPMLKAAAIDHISRDRSGNPARTADRMMKIINESIFED